MNFDKHQKAIVDGMAGGSNALNEAQERAAFNR